MKKLRPVMFVGTGSDVGKSVINTAFCRIFSQDGYRPAPFKAQNMSLNSYATPDGFEIGRAQAVQAEACRIPCSTAMNPILLKPTSYVNCQVILNGKPWGNKSATEYFNGTDRDFLFGEAMNAFDTLNNQYNPIVIEGAGSISEINLRDRDITNMRVAIVTNAAVYIVADIDRGGVFGSVYGTMELLLPDERNQVEGIIINKFRGDIRLFEAGARQLENLTGKPVVGIIPYFSDIFIDQEDSVAIDDRHTGAMSGKINIAVILLPHMSNFTDFNMLERVEGVHLYYALNGGQLMKADIVIIPGSKNTIADMVYLREKGLAKTILQMHDSGKQIYGICGGYQMMGLEIHDPHHVEGDVKVVPGLGLLPVVSTLTRDKTTEQCTFSFLDIAQNCTGYEIHMGETVADDASPLCKINGKGNDGYFKSPRLWGTYIHGIFDNKDIVAHILTIARKSEIKDFVLDCHAFKEEQYDKLARLVRDNVQMRYIYSTMEML